jgi:hypothetical protein
MPGAGAAGSAGIVDSMGFFAGVGTAGAGVGAVVTGAAVTGASPPQLAQVVEPPQP